MEAETAPLAAYLVFAVVVLISGAVPGFPGRRLSFTRVGFVRSFASPFSIAARPTDLFGQYGRMRPTGPGTP